MAVLSIMVWFVNPNACVWLSRQGTSSSVFIQAGTRRSLSQCPFKNDLDLEMYDSNSDIADPDHRLSDVWGGSVNQNMRAHCLNTTAARNYVPAGVCLRDAFSSLRSDRFGSTFAYELLGNLHGTGIEILTAMRVHAVSGLFTLPAHDGVYHVTFALDATVVARKSIPLVLQTFFAKVHLGVLVTPCLSGFSLRARLSSRLRHPSSSLNAASMGCQVVVSFAPVIPSPLPPIASNITHMAKNKVSCSGCQLREPALPSSPSVGCCSSATHRFCAHEAHTAFDVLCDAMVLAGIWVRLCDVHWRIRAHKRVRLCVVHILGARSFRAQSFVRVGRRRETFGSHAPIVRARDLV